MNNFINENTKKLLKANINNAKNEIVWFLEKKFQFKIEDIKLNNFILNKLQKKEFQDFILRRINKEPFQYIINEASFYALEFYVNKHVLIPRPETEIIIDILKKQNKQYDSALDIGTGSGNIAISIIFHNIAHYLTAIDNSPEAIKVTKKNIKKHQINNIKILQFDYLSNTINESFDLIISNPPYISLEEYLILSKTVKNFEPKSALTDNNDGLSFYRKISADIPTILNINGTMILEIGLEKHKPKIENIFKNYEYIWHKDLNNNYRFFQIFK